MLWRWLWAPALLAVLWATPALAETVHLTTGEVIRGRIVRVDTEAIALESDRGFGVIELKRGDIAFIEFEENQRDPSRLVGVGYHHRAGPSNVSSSAAEYGLDALSVKMWLDDKDSLDLQLGFYNADDATGTLYEVLTLEVRYATVFRRQGSMDLYWGGGLGYLSVEDNTGTTALSDTGYTLRAFLGAELFFPSLPSLGIAAEIGIGTQDVGDRSITNLSATTFPAFSLRYYF